MVASESAQLTGTAQVVELVVVCRRGVASGPLKGIPLDETSCRTTTPARSPGATRRSSAAEAFVASKALLGRSPAIDVRR